MPYLQRLFQHLHVAVRPQPTREMPLVKALIEHIFTEATPAEVETMLQQRSQKNLESVPSVLSSEVLEANYHAIPEEDLPVIEKELERVEKERVAAPRGSSGSSNSHGGGGAGHCTSYSSATRGPKYVCG